MPSYETVNLNCETYANMQEFYSDLSFHMENLFQTKIEKHEKKAKIKSVGMNTEENKSIAIREEKRENLFQINKKNLTGYIDCAGRYILTLSSFYLEQECDLSEAIRISIRKLKKSVEEIEKGYKFAISKILQFK